MEESKVQELDQGLVPFKLKSGKEIRIPIEELSEIQKGIRPKTLDYEVFKEIRTKVKYAVKLQRQGKPHHLAKLTEEAWIQFLVDNNSEYRKQKSKTYIAKKQYKCIVCGKIYEEDNVPSYILDGITHKGCCSANSIIRYKKERKDR